MGLDTSHDCWHGPYSSFTKWHNALARAAGYMVSRVEYNDGYIIPTVMVDWGHLQEHIMGEWDKTPDDPLLVLIAHSDCEGVIHPEQAGPLADRLEELLPKIEAEPSWILDATTRFIDGLRRAVAAGEDVDFH